MIETNVLGEWVYEGEKITIRSNIPTRKGEDITLAVNCFKCGMSFPNVVLVLQPDSSNPLILVSRATGVKLLVAILNHLTGTVPFEPYQTPTAKRLPNG